jgi:prevent-host-death family protein
MSKATQVRTLKDLTENTARIVREVRARRRPVIIAEDGKPEVVIIPAEMMRQFKAMQAACELAEV